MTKDAVEALAAGLKAAQVGAAGGKGADLEALLSSLVGQLRDSDWVAKNPPAADAANLFELAEAQKAKRAAEASTGAGKDAAAGGE